VAFSTSCCFPSYRHQDSYHTHTLCLSLSVSHLRKPTANNPHPPSYALAIFLTNAIVLVAVIAVSLYTKLFDTSTAFDFADLGSVIVGVSNSNGQVNGAEHEVKRWRGDPTEPSLQNVILELDCVSRSTDRAPSVSVRWPSATVQRQWRASV